MYLSSCIYHSTRTVPNKKSFHVYRIIILMLNNCSVPENNAKEQSVPYNNDTRNSYMVRISCVCGVEQRHQHIAVNFRRLYGVFSYQRNGAGKPPSSHPPQLFTSYRSILFEPHPSFILCGIYTRTVYTWIKFTSLGSWDLWRVLTFVRQLLIYVFMCYIRGQLPYVYAIRICAPL